jgi:DNA (cytosine-5)-methyltransferase 1
MPAIADDLADLGYCVACPSTLAAANLGAGHIRRRTWVFARGCDPSPISADTDKDIERRQQRRGEKTRRALQAKPTSNTRMLGWEIEPRVDRVVHGVAYRMDRLRALGNGQVPAVVRAAWRLLTD